MIIHKTGGGTVFASKGSVRIKRAFKLNLRVKTEKYHGEAEWKRFGYRQPFALISICMGYEATIGTPTLVFYTLNIYQIIAK